MKKNDPSTSENSNVTRDQSNSPSLSSRNILTQTDQHDSKKPPLSCQNFVVQAYDTLIDSNNIIKRRKSSNSCDTHSQNVHEGGSNVRFQTKTQCRENNNLIEKKTIEKTSMKKRPKETLRKGKWTVSSNE